MGMLDRELRQVRAKVVPNVKRETLQNEMLREVRPGSKVYTDEAVGYDILRYRFVHDVVNHVETYVERPSPHQRNRKFLVASEANSEGNLCCR